MQFTAAAASATVQQPTATSSSLATVSFICNLYVRESINVPHIYNQIVLLLLRITDTWNRQVHKRTTKMKEKKKKQEINNLLQSCACMLWKMAIKSFRIFVQRCLTDTRIFCLFFFIALEMGDVYLFVIIIIETNWVKDMG